MSLVSIIIPAYNAAHFLPDALESCLNQSYSPLEIIVVNDGSSDESASVARSYPNVICIDQENRGLAGARNTGILHATGDYLQFLDADDLLLPDKIKRCMALFGADPSADVVYTDYEIRSPDLSAVSPNPKPELEMGEGDILSLLINTTSTIFRVPCPLLKTTLARQVDGFSMGMQGVEDWNFWVKLAAAGALYRFIPEVLVWYRDSPASMSKDRLLMTRSRLHAMQGLRALNLPASLDLEEKIAGRHHALAMALWEAGQRSAARAEFDLALQTHPHHRRARQALKWASYVFPARFMHLLLGLRQSLAPKQHK